MVRRRRTDSFLTIDSHFVTQRGSFRNLHVSTIALHIGLVLIATRTMTTTVAFTASRRTHAVTKAMTPFVAKSLFDYTRARTQFLSRRTAQLMKRSDDTPTPFFADVSTKIVEESDTKLSAAELLNGATDASPQSLITTVESTTELSNEITDRTYQGAIHRTLIWVALAGVFGSALYLVVGPETAEEFFAGYLVEQSLSVDNLFVFLLLFEFFQVPLQSQDKVLNWGIYGAIVMRATMIGLGAAALKNFHGILLVFAGILVYSSASALFGNSDEDDEEDLNDNVIVRISRMFMDSTDKFDGDNFFTVDPADGIRKATPLFICMIAVELSDVVFAVDSIPAVFGVTENPLVVFSSNMFAIMGLRSLYTILSKAATDLKYLEPAVAVVLGFIGSKMIAEYVGYCIPTEVALAVVATMLSVGIGASVWERRTERRSGLLIEDEP